MAYYKDLREYLQTLEKRDKLVRIKSKINKDTQLHPLVRLQYRGLPEEQRKAFIFDNVTDVRGKKYDASVALCALAGSRDIYAIGMMCQLEEISAKLYDAEVHPIEPKIVSRGPVQEEIHVGDTLMEHGGLDEFPIPISTPGYDVAPYFAGPCWVTKDPENHIRNVGTYRGQLKSPTRTGICFDCESRGGFIHWRKCKERGVPLEAALIVGPPPNVGYVAVSPLPQDFDEFKAAGGIAGAPLELVKCKTVNLEVPAYAEIVVEGEINTQELEPEGPFGELLGFMGLGTVMPYFNVKCITHRKKPIWLEYISQFPPSESSVIRQLGQQGALLKYLKHDLDMSHIMDVAFVESSASNSLMVIKMKRTERAEVWRALESAAARFPLGKIIVAVDEDIDPWDADSIVWALCFRMQPHRDCRTIKAQTTDLADPSVDSPEDALRRRASAHTEPAENSYLLIDATLKWPYPPLSLPKKQFMDEALRLWQKEGLPELKVKEPWWGHNMGYWSEEDNRNGEAAVRGEYWQTGEEQAKRRKKA